MAVRTASVRAVEIVRGDDSAFPGETTSNVKVAAVYIENAAVGTVIGGTDTLACDLGAAISGSIRNGKTITVRSACVSGPAYVTSTAYAATSSLSSNTISLTPKSAADWTTDVTLPVNSGTNLRAFRVTVCYTEE